MSAPPAMPGVRRDPARVAAHHLDDHHAVVALGGRVQAVDRVGRDLHRGVEAEREVGAGEVVVDRLRARRRRARRRRRASAATPSVSSPPIAMSASMRSRASVASTRRGPSSVLYGFVRDVPRIVPPRGSRPRTDRSSEQAIDSPSISAAPTVAVADDRVAVLAHALAHDGPDDRVQPRAVAAAGQHSDPHRCLLCLPYPAASPRPGRHIDGPTPGPSQPRTDRARTIRVTPSPPATARASRRAPGCSRRSDRSRSSPGRGAGCRARRALHGLLAARTLDFAVLTDRRPVAGLDRVLHPAARAGRVYAAALDDVTRRRTKSCRRGRRLRDHGSATRPARCWIELNGDDRGANAFADALRRRGRSDADRMSCVIAIDAGTTGRARVRRRRRRRAARAARTASSRSTSRGPGWVEHDADDIWRVTVETLAEVAARAAATRARRSPRSASPTSARPSWSGTARTGRAARTAPSCGRTGAPRNAATSCAPPGTSR